MGVVTFSSSASRSPLGLSSIFSSCQSPLERTLILAFKTNKPKNPSLFSPHEPVSIPAEASKEKHKRLRRAKKSSKTVKTVSSDEASACTLELDFDEAASKLESIYKLSSVIDPLDVEDTDCAMSIGTQQRFKIREGEYKTKNELSNSVVRNRVKKPKRLSLAKRIALMKNREGEIVFSIQKRKDTGNEAERISKLVREYSVSTDLVSMDWKKTKIPAVLPSSEHSWLFKMMQPMKALLQVKEGMQQDFGQELTDGELAEATNMNILKVRKNLEVGQAARNKLIKHNLRLVLFVANKYFQEFANGPKFHDLCQAGVKGLITAIDRFEPRRKFRLSTYGLFWIRHAIIRSMTLSSFTRVSFGLESLRIEIKRAKLRLLFELQRVPTEEEIIEKVGISPRRYHEVMRASKPVLSLHAWHTTTQEELIYGVADIDSAGGDKWHQPAPLRLALDDVLDSLKPKESLVIRQRYGLDGKGDRTLGEIAGNLNISREMVRKHEVKALMKLKHPARVDYLLQSGF